VYKIFIHSVTFTLKCETSHAWHQNLQINAWIQCGGSFYGKKTILIQQFFLETWEEDLVYANAMVKDRGPWMGAGPSSVIWLLKCSSVTSKCRKQAKTQTCHKIHDIKVKACFFKKKFHIVYFYLQVTL
jgi:hypothetical protein